MTDPPDTILIVEDDAGVARLQRLRLERAGYAVRAAATADEALEQVRAGGIDLMVLDYRLSGAEDGLAFHARLKAAGYDPPVVMVTGYGDDATIVRALRAGVRDYIFKSVEYLDYLPEACRRVLDQVRVRRELADSQALARGVLDSLGAHIAVLDRDGTIIAVNEAWDRFARAHGGGPRTCGVGVNYLDVCRRSAGPYADEAPGVERGIRGVLDGALPFFALEYPCPWLAEPRWFSLQVTRLATDRPGVVVTHADTTERRRAEADLRRLAEERERALADLQAKTDELKATTQQLWLAARLAGVGELAASIAHELNNPLATVSLRVEGVLAKTPADDPRRKPLEVVAQEGERMARLVSNLLNFSRAGRDQVSTVDVCEELVKTGELAEHHLRKRQIRLATEFAPGVPHIHADRQQLRQVFLNLFTNAADAMPDGGRLAVRVRRGELPGGVAAVAVEVADTGVGIPAEHLARVTEAFFTTKEEGKGTGLGLAICKRIVHQHHGRLEIESAVGAGTTVRVTLPVRAETNTAGLRVEPPPLLGGPDPAGRN
jgi:signal transduction histidine kinase/FixJ family two-component response regulator